MGIAGLGPWDEFPVMTGLLLTHEQNQRGESGLPHT